MALVRTRPSLRGRVTSGTVLASCQTRSGGRGDDFGSYVGVLIDIDAHRLRFRRRRPFSPRSCCSNGQAAGT